jgi:hypothetical protein
LNTGIQLFTILNNYGKISTMTATAYYEATCEAPRDESRIMAGLSMANKYLHNLVEMPEAVCRLSTMGSFGKFLAGEVQLEEVSKVEPCIANKLIDGARTSFINAVEASRRESFDEGASNGARAVMRLIQLPVLDAIYAQRRMPGRVMVEAMYSSMAEHALGLVDYALTDRARGARGARELRGIYGEAAVLLLGQRAAIRNPNLDCTKWLPVQSLFSEDHGGDCLRIVDTSWDVDVFTQIEPDDPVDNSHQLQVKLSGLDQRVEVGVPTVHVTPDLSLSPNEREVAEKIILECHLERIRPSKSERLTEELNQREDLLLDILG